MWTPSIFFYFQIKNLDSERTLVELYLKKGHKYFRSYDPFQVILAVQLTTGPGGLLSLLVDPRAFDPNALGLQSVKLVFKHSRFYWPAFPKLHLKVQAPSVFVTFPSYFQFSLIPL